MFAQRETILRSANAFAMEGNAVDASPFGSGHINDTYRITTDSGSGTTYLLQKINHHVFKDVAALTNNIVTVCKHLKNKYAHLGEEEVLRRTMTPIPTKDGKYFYKDASGNYWRTFILITNTRSYDIVETPEQAYSGGLAFGQFQKLLADLDAQTLAEVLPNFHNIDFRLANLRNSIERDSAERTHEAEGLLAYIFEREHKMRRILVMGQRGELPLRITHNDTKFNNVLLDENDQVQCVIDLDTVMPGYVAYDFGDAIRTIINTAAEDETDLSKVKLNLPLYEAYTDGYLTEACEFLTDKELDSLVYGVHLLPYMQAVRFLTDYLEGDHYYKIRYPSHNLVRARSQLKLVSELEKHHDILSELILQHDGKSNRQRH